MDSQISIEQWFKLLSDGYLQIPGAALNLIGELQDAVEKIVQSYPYGFADPHYYTGKKPSVLTSKNARPDGRILIPYIGFMDTCLLSPLANPHLHELLERLVGPEFYLSNTWYQEVAPGTPRLGYHKDARGSVTFNILLDDIYPSMGSTCIIPGSHINTPPARFCLRDLHISQPGEVDMTGDRGDIVFFSTEAWHARSANQSPRRTRRLFYNFYSRSSRDTTTWAGIVSPDRVDAARSSLPSEYGHMFEISPSRTRQLAVVDGGPFRRWAFGKSTSNDLLRDSAFALYAYGKSAESARNSGFLKPYTTRMTEAKPFSAVEYLSRLGLIPTLREAASFSRNRLSRLVRPNSNTVPNAQDE